MTSQVQPSNRLLLADAMSLVSNRTGACNFLKRNIWVVRTLEPVESPVTSGLQLLGETITCGARRDTAVLLTPAVSWRTPLARACIVDSDAAAWHGDVEVVLSEVTAGVGGLDDHLLPTEGAGCEGQSGMDTLVMHLERTVKQSYS